MSDRLARVNAIAAMSVQLYVSGVKDFTNLPSHLAAEYKEHCIELAVDIYARIEAGIPEEGADGPQV